MAHAVVFDNGTSQSKIGIAPLNGDPILVDCIPTLYGKAKELAAMESVADQKKWKEWEKRQTKTEVSLH